MANFGGAPGPVGIPAPGNLCPVCQQKSDPRGPCQPLPKGSSDPRAFGSTCPGPPNGGGGGGGGGNGGGATGQKPSFSPPYNCGKGSDGSSYPTGCVSWAPAVLDDEWNCTWVLGVRISEAGWVPPDPGYKNNAEFSWEARFSGTFGFEYFTGTFAEYLQFWSNPGVTQITLPTCGTNCECDPLPDPSPGNCTFCSQSTSNGADHCNCAIEAMKPYLSAVDDILNRIIDLLAKKTDDACDMTDDCLDKLAKKVKDILDKQAATCESCCQKIQSGVFMSASEAAECADCACEPIQKTCSLAGGLSEGESCTGCGQEPCCCNGFECVPCEGEQSDKKYIGYYNCVVGEFVAVSNDTTPPEYPWVSAGEFDTEQEAITAAQEAMAYCAQPPSQSTPVSYSPGDFNQPPICDINTYASPERRLQYLAGTAGLAPGAAGLALGQAVLNAANQFLVIAPPVAAVSQAVQTAVMNPLIMSTVFGPVLADAFGCTGGGTYEAIVSLSTISYILKETGVEADVITRPAYYALASSCRNIQLNPDQAIAAWLAGSIDDGVLDTHWAIHGICPESVEWYKNAARSKPMPDQIVVMFNRGMISEDEANTKLRQLGFMEQETRDQILELGQMVPPYSDIVRMMVRDADDQGLVDKFLLDTEFSQKFQGQLREWAKSQGIPEKVMQYLWRSHWDTVPTGQLYEMYHRLRYDPKYGGPDKFLDDVKSAMAQNDIAPYWRDKLLAVSFNPLTRVDVRRGYQIGAISDDQLTQSFRNVGYNDADVDTLVEFTKRLKAQSAVADPAIKQWLKLGINGNDVRTEMSFRGFTDSQISAAMSRASIGFANSEYARAFKAGELSGTDFSNTLQGIGVRADDAQRIINKLASLITYHTAIDEYSAGTISRNDAMGQLTDYGMSTSRADLFLTKVDSRLDITHATACETAVRRQYITGGFSKADATATLTNQGITKERADKLVGWWDCQLASRGRQPSVSYLCKWLAEGSITTQEFVNRAKRLGYSADDAIAILTDCLQRINTGLANQAAKRANAEAAAIAKQEAAERRTAADLLRQAKALTAARKAKATAIKNRQLQLASAAEKLSAAGQLSFIAATSLASDELQFIRTTFGLDIDQSLQLLIKVSESWDGVSGDSLRQVSNAIGELFVAEGADISAETDEQPFITNG